MIYVSTCYYWMAYLIQASVTVHRLNSFREFDGNKTLEHEIPRRLLAEDKLFISYLLLYVLLALGGSSAQPFFWSLMRGKLV
ncbi:unnamed protein product, partial [Brassica rapa]